MNAKELKTGIIIKAIAIIASLYGLVLTARSIWIFTYFTTLSNVAIDAILLIFLVADVRILHAGAVRDTKTNAMYIAKFILTVSITITFLVFMFILAPTLGGGFIQAYTMNHWTSFCLHFLTPVLAIVDFLLYDYRYKSTRAHAVFALTPALVYLLFVTIAGYAGARWGEMSAPYNFLNFIAPTGWFGFDLSLLSATTLGIGVFYMVIVLLLIFLALGAFYLKLKDMRRNKKLAKAV